ncbi:MAG TPA: aminotransferase class III-fold pyridoxal phosphate-dependent enzyme, partial [Thermoanaerobaculia bacterium]
PPDGGVLAGLRQVVEDLVGVPAAEVDAAAPLVELGFDSLAMMQVSQAVQQRWGVQVAFRKLYAELPDLAALAAHVEERLPAGAASAAPAPARAAVPAVPPPPSAPAPAAARFGPWRSAARDADGFDERQRRHVDELIAAYTARTRGSRDLAQRHRDVLADVRVSAGFRQAWKDMVYPLAVRRSAGARLWDVDGNEYVDLVCGFGVNLFGHSPEWVAEALAAQLADGMQIGPQSPLAGEVAAMVRELTGLPRVAFCNTGSEAVMAAVRLARTATGRDRVVAFNGSYHGISDGVLGRARGAGSTQAVPVAPGIPARMVEDLVLLDYGDERALEAIRGMAGELAAVLVEPVQSGRPDFQPREFLHRLREITRAAGIALVFDEMITGFRLHPRGAQGWYGVDADMATYGKVVGGGMPLGLVAGEARFLDGVDGGFWSFGDDSYPPANQTFFAGTFCKHPLTLAAARATLRRLLDEGPEAQARLNATTDAFVERLRGVLAEEGVDVGLVSCGSMFRFVFPRHPLAAALFSYHLRRLGVHLLEDRGCFLSTAHGEAELDAVAAAVRAAVRALCDGGLLDAPPAAPAEPEPLRAPMTDGQRGLWAVCRMGDGAAAAFNESLLVRLGGPLDRAALAAALDRLVRRHESLRTSFDPEGAEQRIHPAAELPLGFVDLAAGAAPEEEAR